MYFHLCTAGINAVLWLCGRRRTADQFPELEEPEAAGVDAAAVDVDGADGVAAGVGADGVADCVLEARALLEPEPRLHSETR